MVDDYNKECQLRKSMGEQVDEQELEKICSEDVAQGLKDIQGALPNRGVLGLDRPGPVPPEEAQGETASKEPVAAPVQSETAESSVKCANKNN